MTIEDAFMRVFGDLIRQGPGTTASSLRALEIVRPLLPANGEVLDVGCGTGASTRVLARHLDRPIRASDVFQASIDIARRRADLVGLGDRVTFDVASLDEPGVAPLSAALIWCEAAAYSVGVGRALEAWRGLLVPGGIAVFSELVWLGGDRPAEAEAFWAREYPGMTDWATLRTMVIDKDFELIADFVLPVDDWWESYYLPLAARIEALGPVIADPALAEVAALTRREIAVFRAYGNSYGYITMALRKPVAG
ncbi:class I SAM-dependent methyltransferase [Blastochloris viridis]|uniref:Dimethylglycine N-methyltransferase n=1 Tax=Blastochloris viridis TaxID=1079 RepID=A0A0H5BEB9_BLAVI|nr:class I SAM-dependent methyltransferase [Blastochloris viridis]ALK09556.1 Dimethylglycine N-methyltransferase [Blastochloris viridis]BAS00556.1 transcriptional regulator [Blastochloris viridis]CUU42219.1 Dimethylglycine N-methyltransferase [Blastochloris viridis]